MTHWHHIVPRHQGGTDDPSNLVELTVEEHAEAHRVLWETYGNEYDNIAWRCLAGSIDGEEARRLAVSVAHSGIPKSKEQREKISESRKKDWATNDELRKKISDKMIGNDYGKYHKGWVPNEETRKRMADSKQGRHQRRCSCVLCKKEISVSQVVGHYRWNHTSPEEKEKFIETFRKRFANESKEDRDNRIEKTAMKNRGMKKGPYKKRGPGGPL